MLDTLGEPVAKPERGCGDTPVRPQSHLVVVRRLLDGGQVESPGRTDVVVVRADAGQLHERPCPLCPGLGALDHPLENRPRAAGVARLEDPERSVEMSPPSCLFVSGRRQLRRELGQLAGNHGRAPRARGARCLVQLVCDGRIRALRGQGEVARALLGPYGELCQDCVSFASPPVVRAFVCGRGEERVREADAPVVELDHLSGDGRLQRAPRVCARRRRDDLERRVCERGDEEQHLACPVGKLRDPCADEIAKTLRNDEARPRPAVCRVVRERADKLEREQWVAPGGRMDLPQHRRRQDPAEARLDQVVHVLESERRDLNPGEPRQRSLRVDREPRALLEPECQQEADVRRVEPMRGEHEDSSRGSVEPLDVVHRDDDRLGERESLQDAEQPEPDRTLVGRRLAGRLEQERHAQRPLLRLGQLRDHLRRFGEQIGDPGEGEPGLGLERPGDQDASARRAGSFAAPQPERRLPRAGLALEQERRGPIVLARDERLDRSELLLPPDDLVHPRLPRRWCRSPTSVSSRARPPGAAQGLRFSRRTRSCAQPPSPRFAPRRSG